MISKTDNPIFAALDTDDLGRAKMLADSLVGAVGGIKLGKQFFTAHGPQGVNEVRPDGMPLFLDVKFHDIPNTVAGGIASAAKFMRPDLITIHAGGGAAMVRAARDAAEANAWDGGRSHILAVTVLTSMSDEDIAAQAITGSARDHVLRLGELALNAGADGLVCSPLEIEPLRAALGDDALLVTPGIRPAGSDVGDQKRVMTPDEAMALGASYLVIGRPITGADDPASTAREIAGSLG